MKLIIKAGDGEFVTTVTKKGKKYHFTQTFFRHSTGVEKWEDFKASKLDDVTITLTPK